MTATNGDQAEFWNGGGGQVWVDFQSDLDQVGAQAGQRLLEAADPQPGEVVLDIGCGAGASTLALARAVGPRGQVLGLDISAPLIARARAAASAGANAAPAGTAGQVRFELGDAQVQDFPPGRFDLAVSRFGVMFFDDTVAAFRNIHAALRPGGRAAFAVWQGVASNPWFALPKRVAEARLGADPPGDPGAPGPMALRDPGRVLPMFAAAGFRDERATPLQVDMHHPGGVRAVTDLMTRIGPVSRMLRDRGTNADREAIANDLRDALAPYATADGIRVPAGIVIYSAVKPG